MELYKEILAKILMQNDIQVTFPNLQLSADAAVEMQCLAALQKIKTAIEDDSLSDFKCVEKIVCIFEEIGSCGGTRHDF